MKSIVKTPKIVGEIETLLRSIGFTEYETRAYKNLLRFQQLSADQLAKHSDIPLPRIYDVTESLQRRGLIVISKTRPRMFKLVPLKQAFTNFVNAEKESMSKYIENLEKNMPQIIKTLSSVALKQNVPEDRWYVWRVEKKGNINNILNEQKRNAKKYIKIFSHDLSWIRWKDAQHVLKDIIRSGVKVKIIMDTPKNSEIRKNIEVVKSCGAEILTGYSGIVRGHVIDGNLASIVTKRLKEDVKITGGEPGSDELYEYEMIFFDTPQLVKIIEENFDFWWEKLQKKT